MRRLLKVGLGAVTVLLGAFFAGVFWPLAMPVAEKTDRPIAITSVGVIDLVNGRVVADQTVLIVDKRIRAIGPAADVVLPPNTIMLAGEGRFVMPSLWDMHTHIFAVTPMLDLPLYIAYGVTNVRDMASCAKAGDPFVACPADFNAWTAAAENDEWVGPRIQGTASWQVNGPSVHKSIKGLPDFFGTENAAQARAYARYYAGKVDALKVYNFVSPEAYFALVDEAQKVGLEVVGHRPRAVSAIAAAQHQKSIEHARFMLHESFAGSEALRDSVAKGEWFEDRRRMLDEHDPLMAKAIFSAMKAANTWYVPTHLTRRVDAYADHALIVNDPILRYLHPLLKWQWMEDVNKVINEDSSPEARQTYRDFYAKGLELTGDAHRAGVKVLVGTDYIVAGVTVHDELAQLVKAGMSPLDALRSATVLPTEYFDLQAHYGAVEVGKMADLVVLNNNPLENIRHTLSIETVVFNGNIYDRKALDKLSALVERRANSWSIGCKIVWEFIQQPAAY
ncbi:amidohydrolase family protein [Teredinibacter purpureus]|uniref:amidohydrolase family protein n=1 Tax=Teredinibacter purpureus TaxID=2731756 RepID=UPI0005F7C5CF|nr:amidohydrolase family protein [Teredinibacter purpureus]